MPSSYHDLGVLVWPSPTRNRPRVNEYGSYIYEVLGHAGICYSRISPDDLQQSLSGIRVLLTVGESALSEADRNSLCDWIADGGSWLSVGGLCDLGEVLGAAAEQLPPILERFAPTNAAVRSLGEGYLPKHSPHPVLEHIQIPMHFYNGAALEPRADAEVLAFALDNHGRRTERPLVIENQCGRGRCMLLAPDVLGAIVRIQQGTSVTRDGIPAPDGVGTIVDGVLKCDDGMALDWTFDRQSVPGAPELQGFLQPVADQWRELLLRAIFYLADCSGATIPLLWLYPRGAKALAHMSHDSDGNDPAHAEHLLNVLDEADIKTTWCVISPGYAPELMQQIAARGHELAAHYDAMDHPWSPEEFQSQIQYLTVLSGRALIANKNHFTRWEGDTEFFSWCIDQGIQIDSSKLCSKLSEQGFLFGSAHPYFPVDPQGNLLDVLELPCHLPDLEVVGPAIVCEAIQDAVIRHHGILHLLFHPAHTHRPEVHAALVRAVQHARDAGLQWWTAEAINQWERARRTVNWFPVSSGNGAELSCKASLCDATVLVFNAKNLSIQGDSTSAQNFTFWGHHFEGVNTALTPDTQFRLTWDAPSRQVSGP